VPQFEFSLPHVHRLAVLVLTLGAMLAVVTSAFADDAKSTG
jgi:hypothetical protein